MEAFAGGCYAATSYAKLRFLRDVVRSWLRRSRWLKPLLVKTAPPHCGSQHGA